MTQREKTNNELCTIMSRHGESFADMKRAALSKSTDSDALREVVWTAAHVYGHSEERGWTVLPLLPNMDGLTEIEVVD